MSRVHRYDDFAGSGKLRLGGGVRYIGTLTLGRTDGPEASRHIRRSSRPAVHYNVGRHKRYPWIETSPI
jgi:hypothetical protein